MNERLPQKISRRAFLSTSGKLAIGITGLVAGSTGLFYYGALKHRVPASQEIPSHMAELGDLGQLTALQGMNKIHYEATIHDAWVTKPVKSFVYVSVDAKGGLLILSPVCTHLGCKIDPVPVEKRGGSKNLFFQCPCHGAEFDDKGNAVGVVSQGLDSYEALVAEGKVYIDILAPIKGSISS